MALSPKTFRTAASMSMAIEIARRTRMSSNGGCFRLNPSPR